MLHAGIIDIKSCYYDAMRESERSGSTAGGMRGDDVRMQRTTHENR